MGWSECERMVRVRPKRGVRLRGQRGAVEDRDRERRGWVVAEVGSVMVRDCRLGLGGRGRFA